MGADYLHNYDGDKPGYVTLTLRSYTAGEELHDHQTISVQVPVDGKVYLDQDLALVRER